MITFPTLLLDEQKCRANIRSMAQKALEHSLGFKPHFKTHQSSDIGEWFRQEGVSGITVSSVSMAQYFSNYGWEDITIAFPVNIREMDAINELAQQCKLGLLLSDFDTLELLQFRLESPVEILVEIDTGSRRSGFQISDHAKLESILKSLDSMNNTRFAGFYSHPGHSYSSGTEEEVLKVHKDVLWQVSELKNRYDFPVTVGDTPCCSVADEFPGIDNISPGNFVFYDIMQEEIGSCSRSDVAVALACPIVAKYPERNEMVIYGGAVHLSKEQLVINQESHFGIAVHLTKNSWDSEHTIGFVKALSQEHGIIKCSNHHLNSFNIGDLVAILPVHSCLTANLMAGYRTLDGTGLNHLRRS